MGVVSLPNLGPDPITVNASVLNGKVDPLATEFNGGIDNDNIASGAGIVYSKLSLTGGVVYADLSTSSLSAITQTVGMSGAAINEAKGSDIASATTTDLGAATGNFVHVTGTTTITGLGTVQAGTRRLVKFTGILTLTHNATSLILPNAGSNITTAANDRAEFVSLGSGNWICTKYQRADGTALAGGYTPTAANALAGSIVQVVNVQTGAVATGTTVIVNDDTIPQKTEGDEYMTLAITPTSATNKLKITVIFNCSFSANTDGMIAFLCQDAANDALAVGYMDNDGVDLWRTASFVHYMTSGTTSETTFKVRAGSTGGTLTFNGQAGARKFGGAIASSITIEEIKT